MNYVKNLRINQLPKLDTAYIILIEKLITPILAYLKDGLLKIINNIKLLNEI
jgi:hypothetical protein